MTSGCVVSAIHFKCEKPFACICIILLVERALCRKRVQINGTIGGIYSVLVNSPWCTVLFVEDSLKYTAKNLSQSF